MYLFVLLSLWGTTKTSQQSLFRRRRGRPSIIQLCFLDVNTYISFHLLPRQHKLNVSL